MNSFIAICAFALSYYWSHSWFGTIPIVAKNCIYLYYSSRYAVCPAHSCLKLKHSDKTRYVKRKEWVLWKTNFYEHIDRYYCKNAITENHHRRVMYGRNESKIRFFFHNIVLFFRSSKVDRVVGFDLKHSPLS